MRDVIKKAKSQQKNEKFSVKKECPDFDFRKMQSDPFPSTTLDNQKKREKMCKKPKLAWSE